MIKLNIARILGGMAVSLLLVIGSQRFPIPALQPAPAPTYLVLANVGGTLIYLYPPTAPAATPTRTPSATPTQVTPALPTITNTPLEVTPLGTPSFPRYSQADVNYIPLAKLLIRTAPEKTATNWTGLYAAAGQAVRVYHLREYAFEGAVWGCLEDTNPANCRRWIAIKADLAPVDGVLETYAEPEAGGVD